MKRKEVLKFLTNPLSEIPRDTLFLNLLSQGISHKFKLKDLKFKKVYLELTNLQNLDADILNLYKIVNESSCEIFIYTKNPLIFFQKFKSIVEDFNLKIKIKENSKLDLEKKIKNFYKKHFENFLYLPNIRKSIKTSLIFSDKYLIEDFNIFTKIGKSGLTYTEIKEEFTAEEFNQFKSLVWFGVIKKVGNKFFKKF